MDVKGIAGEDDSLCDADPSPEMEFITGLILILPEYSLGLRRPKVCQAAHDRPPKQIIALEMDTPQVW